MNPDLDRLHPYPFERLAALTAEVTPPSGREAITLAIGEPRHAAPALITEALSTRLADLARYPSTRGQRPLREAIAYWLQRRFQLDGHALDPDRHVLPVSGTREALFGFAQCVIDRRDRPLVLLPNPFYQIYEGATLLAGAEPWYMNTTAEAAYRPCLDDVPERVWQRCQLVYLCSPGNPTGAVLDSRWLERLLALADRHDFVIAADECYSEIYPDEASPPTGLLETCARVGRADFHRCVVFHSLSKRSNVPGLRSGFVAGDPRIIEQYGRYRTYHGCAQPLHHQAASTRAWCDEAHVRENRARYREKFDAVLEILSPVLDVTRPEAGFYLWPRTPIDDERFALELYRREHVLVLPGRYLARDAHGINPGLNRVRMALVGPLEECTEAATRIRDFVEGL